MDTKEKIDTTASITLKHGFLCSIFHKWTVIKTSDDNLIKYSRCKRCGTVKVFKHRTSALKIDWDFFFNLVK